MSTVSFSFSDIISSTARWIFDHVDNISKYSSTIDELSGGKVRIIREPYSGVHQDITPDRDKGDFQKPKGVNKSGAYPTVTWTLDSRTAPSDQSMLAISGIEAHIERFINISQPYKKYPSADDLIQILNHISQFCITSLKFHRPVFEQTDPPDGAESGFIMNPKTYLSYKPPTNYQHASPNYKFSDIVIADTVDETIQNVIKAVSKDIPSVVIQYTFSFAH